MKIALTALVVVLNVLSILILAATVLTIKLSVAAEMVCVVFAGVLVLNTLAIQFGARFGPRKPPSSDLVSTFD